MTLARRADPGDTVNLIEGPMMLISVQSVPSPMQFRDVVPRTLNSENNMTRIETPWNGPPTGMERPGGVNTRKNLVNTRTGLDPYVDEIALDGYDSSSPS